MLELSSQQIADISAHAEQAYPEECCGLMVGKIMPQADSQTKLTYKHIVQLFPMSNEWTADTLPAEDSTIEVARSMSDNPIFTRARRYWIDPKDMLQVQKQARAQGLNILGIYHSHPDHVAEPSECDRSRAWPEYAYTIVSVRNGKAVDVQNWTLDSDHQFQSEAIKVLPSSASARMPVSA
ncbi:MAG: M67 family metallopeptidase [Cyanobacteria bacterium J06650_10]